MIGEPEREWNLEEIFGVNSRRSAGFSIEIIPTGTPGSVNYEIVNLGPQQLEPDEIRRVLRVVLEEMERRHPEGESDS